MTLFGRCFSSIVSVCTFISLFCPVCFPQRIVFTDSSFFLVPMIRSSVRNACNAIRVVQTMRYIAPRRFMATKSVELRDTLQKIYEDVYISSSLSLSIDASSHQQQSERSP